MSEKILRALMQLFAIIAKQDGGLEENELEYVRTFLKQQTGEGGNEEYLALFSEIAGDVQHGNELEKEKKLTSVLDSVKILGICKKINKTLNQTQKIVVLVRLFELVASDLKMSSQRMAIITTVADVFKITKEDYNSIESFVLDKEKEKNENLLVIDSQNLPDRKTKHIAVAILDREITILRIPSINLYFLKYSGDEDLYLNGLGLHKDRIYLFAKGSTIRLPKGKPVYYSDVSTRYLHANNPDKISFVAENLEYNFQNGVKGLNNITFSVTHGNLVGIMGASGTGKTTLLNVLSGLAKPSSGKVTINGIEISGGSTKLSGVCGYIPQDDLLIEELTVFENLYYNAKLCFKDLPSDKIKEKVNETLENLGLFEKKDLKVGSSFNKTISGGQRKRLNIALELIREPAVLFVDEPTSGLSSRDSENVMDLMRELSLKGKLIFIVIHQPSSEIFKMFDKLIILDEGGYMVYFGNPVESVMYFKKLDAQINSDVGECSSCGNVNPELLFNILEARVVDEYGNYTRTRKVSPEKWEQHFQETQEADTIEEILQTPPGILKVPNWLRQLSIFIKRDFKSKVSNIQYVLLTMLEAPVLAFILAYIIRYIADPGSDKYIFRENENIPIYIFMSLIVAVFLGLTVSAEEIFRDRKILKREKFLHLSRSGYLVAKITILFIISALQALAFVLVANSILEIKNMGMYYWFAFFTTAACANMLGLNISSGFNSAITIYIVIPLLIIPMMVLSGAMFSFEKLNRKISRIDKVPMLAEFMPTRWSYEALMVNQFKNNYFQSVFYELDKDIINADFKQTWFIPELEDRLRKLRDEQMASGDIKNQIESFSLLSNELQNESRITPIEMPDSLMLNPDKFSSKIADKYEVMLDDLNHYYLGVFTSQSKQKDIKLNNLLRNLKDTYYLYLDDFHNESVSDQVRKIYERKKIVEFDHRLVRMTDPVYMDPVPVYKYNFRSHFFAPRKYFAGRYYETFWFNMVIIWILILLLYITLYFDLLKKVISRKE